MLVVGPRASGKTTTAMRHANTWLAPQRTGQLSISPLSVDELIETAGDEAGAGEGRSHLAAEVAPYRQGHRLAARPQRHMPVPLHQGPQAMVAVLARPEPQVPRVRSRRSDPAPRRDHRLRGQRPQRYLLGLIARAIAPSRDRSSVSSRGTTVNTSRSCSNARHVLISSPLDLWPPWI